MAPQSSEETSAHPRDEARGHNPARTWYRYAARLLPETGAVGHWVDFGCGRGEFLDLASPQGLEGVGLDYWLPNVAARAAAKRPAVVANLNDPLPFREGSLDGATLIEVIEHIVRAEALAAELGRVIRPGGWLIVTTPNVAHWTYRWRALTGHPPKQEGYHYRFFTRRKLTKLLSTAGFEVRGSASFGKQALLSKLGRLVGRGRGYKFRYRTPAWMEPLLAQHFVWRLERIAGSGGVAPPLAK